MTTVRRRRSGIGTLFVGAVLIVLGGYYLLRNAFGFELPQLDAEVVVPVLAILGGGALLYRYWVDRGEPSQPV